MPLHPVIAADLQAAAGKTPYHRLPVAEARIAARQPYLALGVPAVAVGEVRNLTVPGEAGQEIPVRVYRPAGAGSETAAPPPLLVFFHGSGFVVHDLDTHDDMCRRLCQASGRVVASVEYRLAPEHPFPAGPADCLAATRWVVAHAASLGASAEGYALAGDSAGGCLAVATALQLRDSGRGEQQPGALALWYPVVEHLSRAAASFPSYTEFAAGYGLSAEGMAWFWGHYLADSRDAANPVAAPLAAESLAGLPPAWISVAEYDVLRDEGEAFARRLGAEGVPVVCRRELGLNHGFTKYAGRIDAARQTLADAGAWLRARAGAPADPRTEDLTP